MNTTDKKGTLRKLVEKGKQKGCLSNQEILDALSELNFSPEQLEKLYDKLEINGIEIVEDSIGDTDLNELSSNEDGSSYDGSYIDDPVKIYLREIGNIKMLTPEEEQALLKELNDMLGLQRVKDELHKIYRRITFQMLSGNKNKSYINLCCESI